MILSRTILAAEFEGRELRLAVIEKRLSRWSLREVLTVEDHAGLPGDKLAGAIQGFLRRHRAAHAPLVIVLPRSEVIVRQLALPLEAETTLAKAVSYQIDSLHPFEPDEVDWDFLVAGRDETRHVLRVMVFLAHRKAIEEPAERLRAAGLRPIAVVPSTAALFRLVAVHGTSRARKSAVALLWRRTQLELLAIEAGELIYSREAAWTGAEATPEWLEAELAGVTAQMPTREESVTLLACGETPAWVKSAGRLEIQSLASALDWECSQPEDQEWTEAAALVAAAHMTLGRGGVRINLLPEGLRVIEQRWVRVPSYALGAIVLLLGGTLAARGWIGDALYDRALRREIARLEPAVEKVRRLDDQSRALLARVDAIEALRRETRIKLIVLSELTRIFPADAWIQSLQINEDMVEMTGYAAAASSLLPLLEDSPYLEKVEFLSAISRGADGKELFRIRARITGAKPLGPEGTQP